jgi:5-methylcytosine-specific restriction protein A
MKLEIAKLIQEFAGNYPAETKKAFHSTNNTKIVTETIPTKIRDALALSNIYKVYGSVGKGNWNEIPWIAVLDQAVTTSTQDGYYIVILFDRTLENIFLGLSVGWTQFEREYGIKEGRNKQQAICEHYAKLLDNPPSGFIAGKRNLQAKNKLGKGYEGGAIISKSFPIGQIDDEVLLEDIRSLIGLYQQLKELVGDSILNIEVDTSEHNEMFKQFKKKVALESFSKDIVESMERLIKIAETAPPEVRIKLKKEIMRNRKFADYVKKQAGYICQICHREPFTQKNGSPYAEADHITPLGGETRGLDSPKNMRCLCAQCHAILTNGSEEEIKKLFITG